MRRDAAYILDILEAARLAVSYVRDFTEAEFLQDVQCQDSVIRRIEIVGEADRRVSPETRASLPEIPWSDMIGMRNMLAHEYDGIDLRLVWMTVQVDLPRLIKQIVPLALDD